MERQILAEAVTAEVLRRLRQSENSEAQGVAIGGDWPNWRSFTPGLCPAEEKQALIVHLSPWSMLRLAQGSGQDAAECFLLEMLLLGRSVFLAPKALDYHRYRDTAPQSLYRQYAAGEKALSAMGIRPLALETKKTDAKSRLLTEAAAKAMILEGQTVIYLDAKTIITPLAADALKAARIAVIRQEEEAKPWNWLK